VSPAAASKGAFIPFGFFLGFLDFLTRHRNEIDLVTYDAIAWDCEPDDGRTRFKKEWKHFTKSISPSLKSEGRAQLLIQHDVDSYPHRTNQAVAAEAERNVPTTSMIFTRRLDRKQLQRDGVVAETPYDLDLSLLSELTASGFHVGYHSNAMEQANFDQQMARRIFESDISSLRERFNIQYFSPHGGARGPKGQKNRDLDHGFTRSLGVRYVHNGGGPNFSSSYSDGALNATKIDPRERDLRDFIASMSPGGRYRILLHPQYYDYAFDESETLSQAQWYRQLVHESRLGDSPDPWQDVTLKWAAA